MFWLGKQNTTFCNTSFVKTADGVDKRRSHAVIARKRKIENGSVGQARQSTDEQLEHLIHERLEGHDSHEFRTIGKSGSDERYDNG